MKSLWLCVIFLLLQFQSGICLHNTSVLCLQDQKQFLLQFTHNLRPDPDAHYTFYNCNLSENYYKSKYWNESRDCCDWDGVTCDGSTGFVIGLDFSCSGLVGIIHPNSTLFSLTRLQNLNLAFNNFNGSRISPKFGFLSSLTHLNLSKSMFSGPIPQELYYLSNLISLDMSGNYGVYCDLKSLSKNMTKIEVLLLSGINISSEIPNNMSSFLTHLYLSRTGVHGNLPMNFFDSQPKLQVLRLGGNEGLKGSFPNIINISNVHSLRVLELYSTSISVRLPESIGMLKNLVHMDLRNTSISGRLPESIGLLNKLAFMDISYCNLWGHIPESIGNLTAMETMGMSHNNLSGEVPSTISNLRHLNYLFLHYNNLGGQIPDAFANLKNLESLYLSNNYFVGEIPASLSNMSRLVDLDISSNALTGSFPSRAGNNILLQKLEYLDLSHNFLREYQPSSHLQNLLSLYLGSNEIEGTFPSSICNSTLLIYLDLSNNKLRGKLPPCIGNSTLIALDLRKNEFSGTIPTTLGNSLTVLALSNNQIEGPLPRSLSNSTDLEFVDLGNNLINDTFPWWLHTLPRLRILILKSNNFHGSIISPPVSNNSFSELQIMDFSHNNFTGLIPEKLFATLEAIRKSTPRYNYLMIIYMNWYSVTLSVKGDDREFTNVKTIVRTIDLSSNNFYGSIPESLADLTSLWLLNLSHNSLSGSIPPAFGHLNTLEQLDLSSNQLTGSIPHTLTNLTSLGVLNLSYNHLAGSIPEGNQFSTFPRESYVGNLGLYGPPLTKNYGNGKAPPSPTIFREDEEDDDYGLMMGFTWQAVAMGYGCGVVIGFIIGSVMLSIKKPIWFARFYYVEAANCLKRRKRRGRVVQNRR